MSIPRPHFLLFSDTVHDPDPTPDVKPSRRGGWRFILEAVDGEEKLEVEDEEPGAGSDRLDLLAVVRGLEALDQPSRVTLVTSSRYVARGFRQGLREWRENGWQWECFGQMAPVRNGDLWRRIDRALQYHRVDCRTIGARRDEGEGVVALSPFSLEIHAQAPKSARSEGPAEQVSKTRHWARGAMDTFLRRWTSTLARKAAHISLPTPRATFS